jgi:3-oxoacyl-[acyl-carrier-protein] synthase-3
MKKLKVGLETIVSVLPDTLVKAKDQSYLEPVIPELLKGKFRFPDEVRRFRDEDAAQILGEKVAKKALDHAGLKPSDIDCIICNNCGGRFMHPAIGGFVHHKLSFPIETPALNVGNESASFLDGCELAWNFIEAGEYKRILVVAISAWETIGGHGRVDFTDPMSACMGDGAGAVIVSSQNLKCEFVSYSNRIFGDIFYDWGVTPRAPAHPELKGAPGQPAVSNYRYNTPQFVEWWLQQGEQFAIDGIHGALQKANLNISKLDMVVSNEPVGFVFKTWMDGAEKAGLSRDKWKDTWHRYGNLASATIPVNLAEFWQRGELKKDSIIALLSIGMGGNAPAMLIRWLV